MKTVPFLKTIFFVAIPAIFTLPSCQKWEQEIRAKAAAEFNQKLEAALQEPKNVLSASDMKTVLDHFKDIKLQEGTETPVCQLANGVKISFFYGKELDYQLIASYNEIRQPVLMPAYVSATLLPQFSEKSIRYFCERVPLGCTEPDFPKIPEKWQIAINTRELHRTMLKSQACFYDCENSNCSPKPFCVAECKTLCPVLTLKEVRGW
jgi:hypothetical protein